MKVIGCIYVALPGAVFKFDIYHFALGVGGFDMKPTLVSRRELETVKAQPPARGKAKTIQNTGLAGELQEIVVIGPHYWDGLAVIDSFDLACGAAYDFIIEGGYDDNCPF